MKILWIAHEGLLSGSNICLLEYIDILSSSGYQQEVIIPSFGEFVTQLHERKITIAKIPFYSWTKGIHDSPRIATRIRKWLRNRLAINAITKKIKKTKPDFVATNTITIAVGAYAAKKMRVKHIWFVHEFGEDDHGFIIAGNFLHGAQTMNRLSEKIVFNSKATENRFLPFIDPAKKYIVYNAVRTQANESCTYADQKPFRLIMVGQVAPSKNQADAIKALAICRNKGLDAELTIVGKAEDRLYMQSITTLSKELNINPHIHFAGASDRPTLQIAQSHALLMCSRMEAFGRVTVEALKCGVPVIAADTGGSLEIIKDGENGYFYISGNTESLADSIIKLYNTYERFNKKQIAAKTGEKFNEQRTAAQLQNVFN